MAHSLPPLPYAPDALEPHVDAQTMQIHHGKHHQAYVTNLNAALEKAPELADRPLEQLLADLNAVPEAVRGPVRNNGGGHWNHSQFWQWMAPNAGGEPSGAVGEAIRAGFGDYAKFRVRSGARRGGRPRPAVRRPTRPPPARRSAPSRGPRRSPPRRARARAGSCPAPRRRRRGAPRAP